MKVISFDLDSTLCDTRHRWHMIDRKNGTDWESYSMACVGDSPGPALPLAQLCTEFEIPFIITSGRSECARKCTLEWLWNRGVYPWAVFLCDERHDYLPHGDWKALRLKEIQDQYGWEISLHIDDIKDVARCVESLGIPTMLVHTIDSPIEDHLG